jgi:hypothetical protein
MSKLSLRIDKYLDLEGGEAPQAIARIYPLDTPTDQNAPTATLRREPIPISHQSKDARAIDVGPGRYRVEVVLPSGEMLADDVRVDEGSDAKVVLKGTSSPHEWLGWQYLAGNVAGSSAWARAKETEGRAPGAKRSQAGATKRKKRPAKKRAKAKPARAKAAGAAGSARGQPTGSWLDAKNFRSAVLAASTVKIDQPILWFSHPTPDLLSESWLELSQRAVPATQLIADLNSGQVAFAVRPVTKDPVRAVFRLTHGTSTSSSATPLKSTLPRDFVAVEFRDSLELLSLPAPWIVANSGREAVIEIVVQRVPRAYEFGSSVVVRDEHLALLLAYLSTGGISQATEIAERAKDMLFGKMQNPLAAAAGAYALIGAETDTHAKDWHPWVENLMNWNPKLPDGAIQYATLLLRRGRSQSSEACALLKQASKRGMPYYSLGLRWLLDGLERFAMRDAEAEELARKVRAISSRMHQQSPFTILRLGTR